MSSLVDVGSHPAHDGRVKMMQSVPPTQEDIIDSDMYEEYLPTFMPPATANKDQWGEATTTPVFSNGQAQQTVQWTIPAAPSGVLTDTGRSFIRVEGYFSTSIVKGDPNTGVADTQDAFNAFACAQNASDAGVAALAAMTSVQGTDPAHATTLFPYGRTVACTVAPNWSTLIASRETLQYNGTQVAPDQKDTHFLRAAIDTIAESRSSFAVREAEGCILDAPGATRHCRWSYCMPNFMGCPSTIAQTGPAAAPAVGESFGLVFPKNFVFTAYQAVNQSTFVNQIAMPAFRRQKLTSGFAYTVPFFAPAFQSVRTPDNTHTTWVPEYVLAEFAGQETLAGAQNDASADQQNCGDTKATTAGQRVSRTYVSFRYDPGQAWRSKRFLPDNIRIQYEMQLNNSTLFTTISDPIYGDGRGVQFMFTITNLTMCLARVRLTPEANAGLLTTFANGVPVKIPFTQARMASTEITAGSAQVRSYGLLPGPRPNLVGIWFTPTQCTQATTSLRSCMEWSLPSTCKPKSYYITVGSKQLPTREVKPLLPATFQGGPNIQLLTTVGNQAGGGLSRAPLWAPPYGRAWPSTMGTKGREILSNDRLAGIANTSGNLASSANFVPAAASREDLNVSVTNPTTGLSQAQTGPYVAPSVGYSNNGFAVTAAAAQDVAARMPEGYGGSASFETLTQAAAGWISIAMAGGLDLGCVTSGCMQYQNYLSCVADPNDPLLLPSDFANLDMYWFDARIAADGETEYDPLQQVQIDVTFDFQTGVPESYTMYVCTLTSCMLTIDGVRNVQTDAT